MYKQVMVGNVRRLLEEKGFSISEAARLIGTSKQYLSSILAESEPQSTKEQIMDKLCLLLHTNPARLYEPPLAATLLPIAADNQIMPQAEEPATAADLAILAERHFLAQDYAGCHVVVRRLLNEHAFSLSPPASAQALLLAGKCCCLQGLTSDARRLLREALSLFQKRLTSQPAKYLPLCMDTFRYLGLTEYADQQYDVAIRYYQRLFSLAERFPELSIDLSAKVENAGVSMLRSAIKFGNLSVLHKVKDDIERIALAFNLAGLHSRVHIEVLFCTHVVERARGGSVQGSIYADDELNSYYTEPFAALAYGLLLWDSGDSLGLLAFSSHLQAAEEQELAFVGLWLSSLLSLNDHLEMADRLYRLEKMLQSSWPSLYGALLVALKAVTVQLTGYTALAVYLWQDALYVLDTNNEIPFYIYILTWFISASGPFLATEECEVLHGLLCKTLASFAG